MEGDTTTASMSFVVDEQHGIDSNTKVPTQQSVKAHVDANAGGTSTGKVIGVFIHLWLINKFTKEY